MSFTWLIGYGSLLASCLAVMVFDHWLLQRARLNVEALYRYGVFVAFALSGVTYVALARLQALSPATAAAE